MPRRPARYPAPVATRNSESVPRNLTAQTAAIQRQHQAAHEPGAPVLLVAGPGSGKSATIEERVAHLITQGVTPQEICAISFTNASVRDLGDRVRQALGNAGISGAGPSVSTLHSLALRSLRRGNLIQTYPSDPQVLDRWEIRRLIDEEYVALHGGGLKRTRQIREFHEALISTGTPNPPNYIPPISAITALEATAFDAFARRRRQVYACVLPGEIVRETVTHTAAGLLDPVSLLEITHLIVDEFQDLNPVDIQFVDDLIAGGAIAFVCGDDDQSIYSFRHGSPKGMQDFPSTYGSCVSHTLQDCFRCTPAVLDAAQALISAYAMPQRLPKVHRSLYIGASPPVPGVVHRWRFRGGGPEATAIATSCAELIRSGLPPEEIMILLSNQAIQAPKLYGALDAAGVPTVAHAKTPCSKPTRVGSVSPPCESSVTQTTTSRTASCWDSSPVSAHEPAPTSPTERSPAASRPFISSRDRSLPASSRSGK